MYDDSCNEEILEGSNRSITVGEIRGIIKSDAIDGIIDVDHMSNKITGLIVSVINAETGMGLAYEYINDILNISEDVKRRVSIIIGEIEREGKTT
jgi:hypothetical protein